MRMMHITNYAYVPAADANCKQPVTCSFIRINCYSE